MHLLVIYVIPEWNAPAAFTRVTTKFTKYQYAAASTVAIANITGMETPYKNI